MCIYLCIYTNMDKDTYEVERHICNIWLFSFNNLFHQLVRCDFTLHFNSMILVSFIYCSVTAHAKTC